MVDLFRGADPILQAFIATLGTYLLTAIGTLPVLLFRTAPRHLMDAMMGGAAGVMTAAVCWSLLVPAIEMGGVGPAGVGLLAGGGFIYIGDQLLPHLHSEFPDEATAEGPRVAWQRSTLLMRSKSAEYSAVHAEGFVPWFVGAQEPDSFAHIPGVRFP